MEIVHAKHVVTSSRNGYHPDTLRWLPPPPPPVRALLRGVEDKAFVGFMPFEEFLSAAVLAGSPERQDRESVAAVVRAIMTLQVEHDTRRNNPVGAVLRKEELFVEKQRLERLLGIPLDTAFTDTGTYGKVLLSDHADRVFGLWVAEEPLTRGVHPLLAKLNKRSSEKYIL